MTVPSEHAPAPEFRLPSGLSSADVLRLQIEAGPNEIRRKTATPSHHRLLKQFNSPVIWLLVAAAALSGGLGDWIDAVVIAAILLINAAVGFLQEHRAERAIAALGTLTAPRARVVRDGRTQLVAARDVVPGDLLLFEAGDIVAADARLIDSHDLSINEALLTGESMPSRKSTAPAATDAALIDRRDMAFMATAVSTGTGIARVEAIGRATEIGKIADLLATVEETHTPLQARLEQLTHRLMLLSGTTVVVVALAHLWRGTPLVDVFLAAVSLAVAAVPEGLPVIVTIALAIGVQRMASRQVLVRRLASVETLGCATVICTDKTGTLTTGTMAVRELWGLDHERLLFVAAACCDAERGIHGHAGTGDPTELAILEAAEARGITKAAIERDQPRVRVTPFDAEARFMAITRADGVTYLKGAVDTLAARAAADLASLQAAHAQMAARGLRVLAVATARTPDGPCDMTGLIGIADPPRSEAVQAVADARQAGITTVMITGDHVATARAIAREIGLLAPGDDADVLVHARATPSDKLRIVREWKARGAIVAMTGDGVNDAPALREAHIGIAMGVNGTEVAREAADMVLADDNFASIIAAVREGRGIFENIRKTVVYLLTGNLAELMVMLVAALLGLPLPLLPLHLLWINVVTDSFPALALVMDPARPDLLRQPPRDPREPFIGRREIVSIAITAGLESAVTLAVFVWGLRSGDLASARGLAFSLLVFSEVFRVFAARSTTHTLWGVGPFSNRRLLLVVVMSTALQLTLVGWRWSATLFGLESLGWSAIGTAALLALVPVSCLELWKLRRLYGRSATLSTPSR